MAFINVGAYVNGERPHTKKALREALASAPDTVRFDKTSAYPWMETNDYGYSINPADILTSDILAVVGPDPYTSRKWYATVTRNREGKVTIK